MFHVGVDQGHLVLCRGDVWLCVSDVAVVNGQTSPDPATILGLNRPSLGIKSAPISLCPH